MEDKLTTLQKEKAHLDVITFAGNGEPTANPHFPQIIDYTIELRDKYFPKTKISVLTNGMNVGKPGVFDAMRKVDNPILKLDSAFDETVRLMDRPNSSEYSVAKQVELYKRFGNDFILQTMFLKGEFEEKYINNSTEEEVSAWLELVKELKPREVMIYTIDRETPAKRLEKVSIERLREIAAEVEKLGIKTNVAG